MQWLAYGLTIFAGMLNAIQPGCNATLNKALGMPFVAGMIVAAVSFMSLLTAGLLFGQISWPASDAIGNLSGFAGPYVMGWLKDATGAYTAGLLTIAGTGLVGAGIVLALHHDTKLELAPKAQAAE